jgi:iduronate 2-sulfatase
MSPTIVRPILMMLVYSWGSLLATSATAEPPLNVLFIAVDDLRPELNSYGASHIKSPNIDRLAEEGLQFERAYVQQAVCNPSRTSLLTGMRPDRVGVTGNHVHFRDKHPDTVTLPQHFKQNGYRAEAIGKIYHGFLSDGSSKTIWDTMGDAESWSAPALRFGPRYYYTEEGIRQAKQAYIDMYKAETPGEDDWTKKLVFGPMTEAPDVEDDTLHDGKVAKAAIKALGERAADPATPFFLAVGFIKPHTPFVAPKKYWDLYDPADIDIVGEASLPAGGPKIAGHRSGEVRRYTDQPNRGPFEDENQRRLRHGYYACISYVDAQIGRVLDELERLGLRESTAVVLFGDHGWHLGEHGLWGKTTNFELDTNAPLIIRSPKMKGHGQKTRALVEFVDIYPTVADLAGLPVGKHLAGKSMKPLLDDPTQSRKEAAFSQYPRGGNADTGGIFMGYSVRTDRWRYTEWIRNSDGEIHARELYDHENDPAETKNVAEVAAWADVVATQSAQLETYRSIRGATDKGRR